jgi:L-threonylcarbamoyladenylate synthase
MNVKTQILKVDPLTVDKEPIDRIAGVLKKGGIIVYPTDTFYGLGCNCFSGEALGKVYRIKQRKSDKPLSVVISDLDMLRSITIELPAAFEPMASEFWPGPLTMILKAAPLLPAELLGEADSVGVRLPQDPWVTKLVKTASFPITATSANIAGQKETADPEEVIRVFNEKVDLIVDGGQTPGLAPSTIIDLTCSPPIILREGAIPASSFKKYIIP